jgi:hypothetical protein
MLVRADRDTSMTRTRLGIPLVCAVAVCALAVGCNRNPAGDYTLTATIRDLMDATIDPNADYVWDSVETIVTREGTTKKEPRTDEEWLAVRRHALALAESTNLLIMPGRQVAAPGAKAEDPRIDFQPEEIQTLMNQNRADWTALARGLHDAAMLSVKAADSRSVPQLLDAGDTLDQACEACHRKYWYRKYP